MHTYRIQIRVQIVKTVNLYSKNQIKTNDYKRFAIRNQIKNQ